MALRRIVIFSALYMPHLGGVEKYTQSIAAELSKDSQITIFCMNTENQPEYRKEGEVDVYYLPCFSIQKGRFPIPKLSAVSFVRDWFAQNKVDFGIVQCRFYLLSLIGCNIFDKYHIPFIQIEHGAGDVVFSFPPVNWLWHLYDGLLTCLEKRVSHDYYAVSEAGLRWLKHYGILGKGVIYNSINPLDFEKALSHPGFWKHSRHLQDDSLLIAFTGRVMREKGVLDLLHAFDRLKGDNLILVIAGDGNMNLVQPWMGRDDILFTGKIPISEIYSLLIDTTVFCLPSHFVEGMPTSVLEAGCCGKAVVASDRGGTAEIIPDSSFGSLVPTGDVDALTESIQWFIDHPQKSLSTGLNLRSRILELFTWETAAGKVRELMAGYGL